jgi:hypothetical protein
MPLCNRADTRCVSIAGHITGLRKQGRLPFGLSHEKT